MGFTRLMSFEEFNKVIAKEKFSISPDPTSPWTAARYTFNLDQSNFNPIEYPLPRLIDNVWRSFKLKKNLRGYNRLAGELPLREAIAELARLRIENLDSPEITPANIFVGNSVSSLLDKVIQAVLLLSSMKNEIIFHYPTYPIFNFLILKNGGKPVPIRTTYRNNFLPTPDEIEKAITPKTAAICLVYPCNPTGATFTDKRPLERIFFLARKNNIVLIADEIYQDTMHGGEKHISSLSLVDSLYNMVSLTSLSKDRPGFNDLRVGYAVADPRIICILALLASAQEWQVPMLIQNLLLVDTCMRIAQKNVQYQHWLSKIGLTISEEEVKQYFSDINNIIGKMERHAKIIYDILADSPRIEKIIKPRAGNILFFKIRTPPFFPKIRDFKKCLLKKLPIYIRPGEDFLIDPDDHFRWFRITITQSLNYTLLGVYMLLGFSKNKRNKSLKDQLEREIKYDPKNLRNLTAYASALLDLNKHKKTLEILNKISPADDILVRYQYYYLRGILFLKLGKLKRGIEWLKKAIRVPILNKQLWPEGNAIDDTYYYAQSRMFNKAQLYYNIGVAYSFLKEKRKADWYLKKAKSLGHNRSNISAIKNTESLKENAKNLR
jgi:aspartate/methionine/tyrosine aminotransferase